MTSYRIGEAARATGLSAHTIRFYESRGLLPGASRSGAGYRQYNESDLRRLRLARHARTLGIPLVEVSTLIEGIAGERCADYASRLIALADRQRAEVDQQIAALLAIRDELDEIAASATAALESEGHVAECACCLLMDDAPEAGAYCATPIPAPRFSGELLEVLQCDIAARPDAPLPADLAPYLRGVDRQGASLTLQFDVAGAHAVRAFAAAECACRGGLGWEVDQSTAGVTLRVSGTPTQINALAVEWPK